jgi:hypothetical protein
MKINFLLTTLITVATGTAITSCSTSYKTGQTPDDVYYSPVRLQTDNARKEDNVRRDDNTVTVYDNPAYPVYIPEDRELRRRVHNRRYRRYNNDYPNGYNGYPLNQNPKSGTPRSVTATNTTQPRKTNLGAYAPKTTAPDSSVSYNPKSGMQNNPGTSNTPVRTFSTPNNTGSNGNGFGNFLKKVFTTNGSNNSYTPGYGSNSGSYNNNNTNASPSRSFERTTNNETRSSNNNSGSSSTTSSPSNSSSNTSAPVRTFKKDN